MHMLNDAFLGRIAVVTGGASGIGRAISNLLVEFGARVMIWDVNQERLRECAVAFGDRAFTQRVDVANGVQVDEAMSDIVARHGPPTYLVNNAGIIGRRMQILDFDEAKFDRVLAVNLKSVFLASRAFVRHSQNVPGRAIVNMSSSAARTGGMPGSMVYAATKGAITSLTISMAKELSPEVRVNALAPGVIDTEIQAAVFSEKSAMSSVFSQIPLGRAGDPKEVAEAAVWLLSPCASYVTGTQIDVSGGR